jgi:DNA-binding response OmpR family regulator
MTSDPVAILVVEDDAPTRTFLADNLTADGYALLTAGCVRDAVRALEYHRVDLAIVDVGLPDESGLELVRRVREAGAAGARLDARLPLIVLSGRAGDSDRVRSFERGADDFVAKPFAYGELRLRIAAVLRRASARRGEGLLRVGELVLDPMGREVWLRGTRVPLASKEFALLRALAAEPTRVLTKGDLLRDVWGFRALGATRTLDTHACRLRQKLAVHGDRYVINVWGVGYRLLDGSVGEEAAVATAAAATGQGTA